VDVFGKTKYDNVYSGDSLFSRVFERAFVGGCLDFLWRISVDFGGFRRISVDFGGFRWISVGFGGFRWISVGFGGFRWVSVDFGG
jgi:hypothetical protein